MSKPDFVTLWRAQPDPRTRDDLLRARFRHDRVGFLRYTLPSVFPSAFDPFHLTVLGSAKQHWTAQLANERRLNLAPRGDGKSTITKGDLAHSIVYGLRRFVIVVAATQGDAKDWAHTLRAWFEQPSDATAELHRLYGPFWVTGEQHRFTVHGSWGKTTIWCASVRTSVQGANELTHRPDEVILDDWEDRKHVHSEAQRAAWKRKLQEEILKLGDRRRGLVVTANVTINHPDAPSACIRRDEDGFRGWEVREFPAILEWPTSAAKQLWEQCSRIYLRLSLGGPVERYQLARRFYQANQARMDEGARVLNPAMLSLFDCYVMIWQEGLAAFLREMQHVESVNLNGLFESSRFTRCRVELDPITREVVVINGQDGRRVPLSQMVRRLVRWDWARGTQAGDDAALACILRDGFGYGYVVDGWLKRVPTTQQVAAAWAMCERWEVTHLSVETNQAQSILIDEVWPQSVVERQRHDPPLWTRAEAHAEPAVGNKEDELAALEPATTAGLLQFAVDLPPEGLAQFDAFDGVANSHRDDFHDAVARGWALTGGMPPRMGQSRVWG